MARHGSFVLAMVCKLWSVRAQGALQLGGQPPQSVTMELCSIGDVFSRINVITSDQNCRSGCAGGTGNCADMWMPGAPDECLPECGRVFEPFWDQCGSMLTMAHMGGMEEMNVFYEDCLEELYPPGVCGTYCNEHTYDCFLTEIHEACCDEAGTNCNEESDVPNTCPVGCAIVFPEFMEICHDHVEGHEATISTMELAEFEEFEQECLTNDGLALVEYALDMKRRGCFVNLRGDGNCVDDSSWVDSTGHGCEGFGDDLSQGQLPCAAAAALAGNDGRTAVDACCVCQANQEGSGGGHRRLQAFLMQRLGSSDGQCSWDEIDDLANDVSMICCGANNEHCPDNALVPNDCTPGCAVALHEFTSACGGTVSLIDNANSWFANIMTFEQSCLDSADPLFFLNAIKNARCDLPCCCDGNSAGLGCFAGGACGEAQDVCDGTDPYWDDECNRTC